MEKLYPFDRHTHARTRTERKHSCMHVRVLVRCMNSSTHAYTRAYSYRTKAPDSSSLDNIKSAKRFASVAACCRSGNDVVECTWKVRVYACMNTCSSAKFQARISRFLSPARLCALNWTSFECVLARSHAQAFVCVRGKGCLYVCVCVCVCIFCSKDVLGARPAVPAMCVSHRYASGACVCRYGHTCMHTKTHAYMHINTFLECFTESSHVCVWIDSRYHGDESWQLFAGSLWQLAKCVDGCEELWISLLVCQRARKGVFMLIFLLMLMRAFN